MLIEFTTVDDGKPILINADHVVVVYPGEVHVENHLDITDHVETTWIVTADGPPGEGYQVAGPFRWVEQRLRGAASSRP